MQHVIDRARELIEKHGLYLQHVGGSADSPAFTYSVGLEKNLQHPEIIMVGFDPQICQQLINDVAAKIKAGERFDHPRLSAEVIRNFNVAFRPLASASVKANTGVGQVVVGAAFEAVQMFLPDAKGLFPWDDGCNPKYAEIQVGMFEPEGAVPGIRGFAPGHG